MLKFKHVNWNINSMGFWGFGESATIVGDLSGSSVFVGKREETNSFTRW